MQRVTFESGTVADVMHAGVLTCGVTTPLSIVARMMALHRIHAVVVYEGGDTDPGDTSRFRGVVSDRDLVAAAAEDGISGRTAGGYAKTPALRVAPEASLGAVRG